MRSAYLLVFAVTLAHADAPPSAEELIARTRDASADIRRTAAADLAKRVATSADARVAALAAVLTDDPDVRAVLVKALIDAGTLSGPAAARIPTLAVVDMQLPGLLAKSRPRETPRATDCRVESADARGTTIACHLSRCSGGCIHTTVDLRVRAAAAWKLLSSSSHSIDDGSCGCCMHLD